MQSHPFHGREVEALILAALSEDHTEQDVTALALVPIDAQATAVLEVRAAGIICGLPLLEAHSAITNNFPSLRTQFAVAEGSWCDAGRDIATVRGDARELLAVERTLLNFLQRLSGIATATAACVAALAGTKAQVQETRKTCPGWRTLDKYAVRVGGGLNHRFNLADRILIKENHVSFCGGRYEPAACVRAVELARARWPDLLLEIEVENMNQLDAVLGVRPDVVMLDGFTLTELRAAVAMRDRCAPQVLLEASGGITMESLAAVGATGIDRVSMGALTHSVKALDLAFKIRSVDS